MAPHPEPKTPEVLPAAPRSELPYAGTPPPTVEKHAVVLFDKDFDRSLINLVPEVPQQRIQEALFDAKAEPLFKMNERELYKELRSRGRAPSPTDNRLRLAFWIEYDSCQSSLRKQMDMVRVFAGVCSKEYFYDRYLKDPEMIAWLLCPPVGYAIKCEEALEFSIEQLRDILSLDHGGDGGKPFDHKLAKLKAEIHAMLDIRVKGAPIQKTVAITAHATGKQAAAVMGAQTDLTMEELDRRLKAAYAKERELLNGRTVAQKT